ncbi:MAG: Exodeoxyribonuclease VII small subunit [Clostridium sp.]
MENKELELLEKILREIQDIKVIVQENLEDNKIEVEE